jgi:hypothetical protein
MKLSQSLVLSAVALTLVLAAVPAAQAQERPLETQLAGVEDTTCGPLDRDFEYGCRMVFWGFYVFEHQLICSALPGVFPDWYYVLCQRAFDCGMPGEPPRDGSGLDFGPMRGRC